jgi:hypothetical protein
MNQFLFPQQYRTLGWIILIPAILTTLILILGGYEMSSFLQTNIFAIANLDILSKPEYFTVIENSFSDEILLILIIIGGLMAGFSKHAQEDELIAKIRHESLVWAVYINFGLMLVATLFFYGLFYLNMMVLNIFSLLFFFLIRFQLKLYQTQVRKSS